SGRARAEAVSGGTGPERIETSGSGGATATTSQTCLFLLYSGRPSIAPNARWPAALVLPGPGRLGSFRRHDAAASHRNGRRSERRSRQFATQGGGRDRGTRDRVPRGGAWQRPRGPSSHQTHGRPDAVPREGPGRRHAGTDVGAPRLPRSGGAGAGRGGTAPHHRPRGSARWAPQALVRGQERSRARAVVRPGADEVRPLRGGGEGHGQGRRL